MGNGIPKENMHYTCIACITIDSVLTIDKKNHPQVYLEECKYRIKKTQMPKFIKNELKSDSDSDLEIIDAKINNELESDSDNNSGYDTVHWFFLHGWFFFYFHVFNSFELIKSFLESDFLATRFVRVKNTQTF